MKTERERISCIISHFCKSKAEFARLMDEKPQTVSNWVARGAGRNVLDKIISKFPQINANWLITGEGKMLNEGTTIYPSENIDTDTYINNENINEIPQYEMPTINEMIKVISLLSEQGKENAQANKINAEANKINAEANDRNSKNMERMMEMLERMLNKEKAFQEKERA